MPNFSMKNSPISDAKFGYFFSGVFAVFFSYAVLIGEVWVAISTGFLSIIFIASAIFIPSALSPLNKAWLHLGLLLGKVISPFVLSIIFFALIVPVALIGRLFGRDELLIKKRQVASYWIDKGPIDPNSFNFQF